MGTATSTPAHSNWREEWFEFEDATYLNVAAALHFLACIPNTLGLLEFVVEEGTNLRQSITETIKARDGMVAVPDGPGLGVEMLEDGSQKFRVA